VSFGFELLVDPGYGTTSRSHQTSSNGRPWRAKYHFLTCSTINRRALYWGVSAADGRGKRGGQPLHA
jgi:hypothetical protein